MIWSSVKTRPQGTTNIVKEKNCFNPRLENEEAN